jgi:hypothetical protein
MILLKIIDDSIQGMVRHGIKKNEIAQKQEGPHKM